MARKSSKQSGSKQTRTKQTRTRQTRTRQTRTRQTGNRSTQKKTRKKRQLNEFMKNLQGAKKTNAPFFKYNGNKYVRKELDTGMVVYKRG